MKSEFNFYRSQSLFGNLVLLIAFFSSTAFAQSPSIISISPNPLMANSGGTITVRFNKEVDAPFGLECTNIFGQRGILSVTRSGSVLTLEHDTPEFVVGFGTSQFCDKAFPIPPMPAGDYSVQLRLIHFTNLILPRVFSLGSVCVGACVIQQVPLNFAAGSAFWWLAIATLSGLGGYAVRRRGLNGRR
jgi:hypothetical protein